MVYRMMRNPKLMIAVMIVIVFAVIMDVYVLHARGNPLPDPDEIETVSFIEGGDEDGAPGRKLDIELYRRLHGCLDGFERVIHSGTGELAGTLVLRRTDGRITRAKLYEWGLVRTEDGLFMNNTVGEDRTGDLCSVIRQIRG